MPSDNIQLKYAARIPELDGIRGIAILMVVACHAFPLSFHRPTWWVSRLTSYGTAGVDLFFALSGFLITGNLLSAKGHANYFRNFYAKRALRIWPLYYLLLLLAFGIAPWLIVHARVPVVDLTLPQSRSAIVYIFLLQNIWYGPALPRMLSVTWSLAIEEQFYLTWPWLVLLYSRKTLAYILSAILVLSPLVRLWARHRGVDESVLYFMTYSRLDGLSFGALVALYCQSTFFPLRRTKWLAIAAMAAGVPISLWLLSGYSKVLWPFLYSMVAVSSAGAVAFAIWCRQTKSIGSRLLGTSWLCYVGQVSYCLYVVHVPVYQVLGSKLLSHYIGTGFSTGLSVMVLGFAVSLGIATLSWYFFESRILKLKDRLLQAKKQTRPSDSVVSGEAVAAVGREVA